MYKKMTTFIITLLLTFSLVACNEGVKYTVAFDLNGGNGSFNEIKVKENEMVEEPKTKPTLDNYEFVEWQLNGEKFNFSNTKITEDITLVAFYQQLNYINPVWEPILADPSVIEHEGVYYAFGTQDEGTWGDTSGVVIGPILSSTNLVDWQYETSMFNLRTRPIWGTANAGLWAPDVVKIGDKFLVYYSLSVWGDPDPGIGVAVADHPLGPWTDHGKLFTSNEIGVNNSIDASVFVDDNQVYIIWGSFRGLYGVELTSDGLDLKNGIEYAKENKVHIAGLETNTPWNGSTYEAPYIIKKDGYYYMFVSSGTCCEGLNSTYNVRVSRSENPLGPYVDHLDRSMLAENRGFQVLRGNDEFVGVGHNGIAIDDDGNYYIVYHGFDTKKPSHVGNSNRRSMFIDLLLWDNDGWPYVSNLEPSNSSKLPIIK